jgi:thiol-disulfide isomerase/thioredoxin
MSQQRPRVIFFFMNGCPHCERTWPAWDKAKGSIRKVADVYEKESKEVSPDDGVSSFPTIVVMKGSSEVKRIEGARENPRQLIKELGLRRSRPLRRRTHRGRRQLTKRTLRNYKAF